MTITYPLENFSRLGSRAKILHKILARSAGLIPACPTEVRRACRQAGADATFEKEATIYVAIAP